MFYAFNSVTSNTKHLHKHSSPQKFLCRVVYIFALTVPLAAQAVTIEESFKNSTAPGWNLSGTAVLTAADPGSGDADGDGWLRLTSADPWQSGSAIYSQAFPSTEGIQATFEYATYGGTNSADGFTFYLIDGNTDNPTIGATGGSLGYSYNQFLNTPGVTNGYIGIGFDEFGNFSYPGFGECGAPNAIDCNPNPNSVAIRGAGNLSTGFPLLASAGANPISSAGRAASHQVRITLTPTTPEPTIAVEMNRGSGWNTVIDNLSLTNNGSVPATFKMGFSASTGLYTNFHEIRAINISSLNKPDLKINLSNLANPILNQPYNSTFTCENEGSADANGGTFCTIEPSSLPPGLSVGSCTITPSSLTWSAGNPVAINQTVSCKVEGTPTEKGSWTANGTTGFDGSISDTQQKLLTITETPPAPTPVPTLSNWATLILFGLLAILGIRSTINRRQN